MNYLAAVLTFPWVHIESRFSQDLAYLSFSVEFCTNMCSSSIALNGFSCNYIMAQVMANSLLIHDVSALMLV